MSQTYNLEGNGKHDSRDQQSGIDSVDSEPNTKESPPFEEQKGT